jgi:membrane protease YdiL (CAAX protease family)
MRETFRLVFLTRHGDVRSGWKVLLFLLLTAATVTVLAGGSGLLFGNVPFVGNVHALLAVILASWILTRFINKKPLGAIGLWFHPRTGRELGTGILVGFLMMSAIFVVMLAAGYVDITWRALAWGNVLAAMLFSLLVFAPAAAFEELLFRGYAFQTLAQGITMLPAILVMSGLFGGAHLQNPHSTLLSTVNVMLAGIWLSLAYLKTRGLWLPFGLHLSWNFTQTTVYGFPTSGFAMADRQIWSTVENGPDWITGGPFGPEGGILATLVLLAGTWYVVKSGTLNAPEGIVTLDTVEDLMPSVALPPTAAPDREATP